MSVIDPKPWDASVFYNSFRHSWRFEREPQTDTRQGWRDWFARCMLAIARENRLVCYNYLSTDRRLPVDHVFIHAPARSTSFPLIAVSHVDVGIGDDPLTANELMDSVERGYWRCLSTRAHLHVLVAYVSGIIRQRLLRELRAIAMGWCHTYGELPDSLVLLGWLDANRRPRPDFDDRYEHLVVEDYMGELILVSKYRRR